MAMPLFAKIVAAESHIPDPNLFRLEPCSKDELSAVAFSLRGLSHARSSEPLQDYCSLSMLPNGWLIGVAADGVGSEPRAEVGSMIAAEAVTAYCTEFRGPLTCDTEILDLLRSAYHFAYLCLSRRAWRERQPLHNFGTTLHTALFTGESVYYGHAGDGGLLVMDSEGILRSCTEPQKCSDGESVITLLAGSGSWQFGKEENVVSALIATDGAYDKLASRMLKLFWNGVDCNLAAFFMSPWAFDLCEKSLDENLDEMIAAFRTAAPNDFYPRIVHAIAQGNEEAEAQDFVVRHVLQGNRLLKMLKDIQDDITIVAMQNTEVKPRQMPLDYYLPPDWEEINRRIYKELYGKQSDVPG